MSLGQRMLHTTPESLHATFPIARQNGDLVLTAGARTDNRDDLIRRLERRAICWHAKKRNHVADEASSPSAQEVVTA